MKNLKDIQTDPRYQGFIFNQCENKTLKLHLMSKWKVQMLICRFVNNTNEPSRCPSSPFWIISARLGWAKTLATLKTISAFLAFTRSVLTARFKNTWKSFVYMSRFSWTKDSLQERKLSSEPHLSVWTPNQQQSPDFHLSEGPSQSYDSVSKKNDKPKISDFIKNLLNVSHLKSSRIKPPALTHTLIIVSCPALFHSIYQTCACGKVMDIKMKTTASV